MENKKFDPNTFDSVEKYKMLDKINEFFELSTDNSMKRRITRIIIKLHKSLFFLNRITDTNFFNYAISLVEKDFSKRIDDQLIDYNFRRTIEKDIVTRLKNYASAKFKNLKKERNEK